MSLRLPLLLTTLLAAPLVARAQPITGAYVGLGAGGNALQQQQSRPSPGLGLTPKVFNWDFGEAGLASVGYGFGNGLRLEVEGHYRRNELQGFGRTATPAKPGGTQQEYGAMLNALYDLDIGSPYVFPYLGLGAGYAHTELNGVRATGPDLRFRARGDFNSLGYQGIVGSSFPTPWVLGLSLTAEYRFFGIVDGGSYQGQYAATGLSPAGTRSGSVKLFNDYNHSVLIGLRYAFDPAPPAAPAPNAATQAPEPSRSRTYVVFFDWDRAELTGRARQVIGQAAQAGSQPGTVRIEVNGHTDASGTAAYNQRLSIRRAETVTAELVRDGVPRALIEIRGHGEAELLVPTAAGVREPQNRRVEIVLR